MHEIDRAPLRVNGARYRIDRNLAVCNGLGLLVPETQIRTWRFQDRSPRPWRRRTAIRRRR